MSNDERVGLARGVALGNGAVKEGARESDCRAARPSRYGSIDNTASAAHSDGEPEGGRSIVKASANP